MSFLHPSSCSLLYEEAHEDWKKKFFFIWSGQALSLVGSGLVQFALVWWLTQTTGSAAVLASATLAAMLPEIFLGPFAGALVDRFNRKTVMIAGGYGSWPRQQPCWRCSSPPG